MPFPSQVSYLGKLMISGTKFLSGCTEPAVVALVERRAQESQHGAVSANSLLEIRPFQVRLQHFEEHGEDTVSMDTYQVARIAFCTADHSIKPNIFAWIYREINDDLSFQMDCHAVECENKLEAKKLAHSMMEAFHKTFHSMRSDGRIHKSDSAGDVAENPPTPEDSTPDDGWTETHFTSGSSTNLTKVRGEQKPLSVLLTLNYLKLLI